ncbi:MAG: hypothetical protein ACRDD8_12405 [Bacteroidales bacterium]
MKLIKDIKSTIYPIVEIKPTFVRVPKNITIEKITHDEIFEDVYSYNEEIYTKDEYIEVMDKKDVVNSSITLDLDFRVMEVEMTLEEISPKPMVMKINKTKGVMDMTPYEMCKVVITGGLYTRDDMEYKISVYVKRGRMTQVEADELIALMDARDLVIPPKK